MCQSVVYEMKIHSSNAVVLDLWQTVGEPRLRFEVFDSCAPEIFFGQYQQKPQLKASTSLSIFKFQMKRKSHLERTCEIMIFISRIVSRHISQHFTPMRIISSFKLFPFQIFPCNSNSNWNLIQVLAEFLSINLCRKDFPRSFASRSLRRKH